MGTTKMKYTHIRNATALLAYEDVTFLVDPYFSPKGAGASYSGGSTRSPVVDLPLSIDDILGRAAAVLVTHLHEDHFDAEAKARLPKDMPILCTLPLVNELSLLGFANIVALEPGMTWRGVTFLPVRAQHGPEHVLYRMGHVMGYVLRAAGEPSLYLMSDTILVDHVREAIAREQPDVLVMNAGGAFSRGKDGPIIMDAEQVMEVMRLAPLAKGLAVHLEATDHCRVTRASLSAHAASDPTIARRLILPADGDTILLEAQR
jgi:L-ascorbate metabolism protein UlaG (beta-lactamase superfamily)